jgi:hypothetical protein
MDPVSEVDAIAEGLAERLATIPDFQHRAYDVEPDVINPPCVFVLGPNSVEDLAMGGDAGVFEYSVVAVVSLNGSPADAQRRIRKYLAKTGESSMQVALEGDPTLGGRAATLIVQGGITVISDRPLNEMPFLGAARTVTVYTQCS